MKREKLPCTLDGRPATFQVWVGRPAPDFDPLHFQTRWLREERGGELDAESVEAIRQAAQRSAAAS